MVARRNQKQTRDIQVVNIYSEDMSKAREIRLNTAEHAAKNRRTEMGRNNQVIKGIRQGQG